MDGPKEKWKPSVPIVKAVIQFAITTKKLSHSIENEAEGSVDEQRREIAVDEQRREIDGRAA